MSDEIEYCCMFTCYRKAKHFYYDDEGFCSYKCAFIWFRGQLKKTKELI